MESCDELSTVIEDSWSLERSMTVLAVQASVDIASHLSFANETSSPNGVHPKLRDRYRVVAIIGESRFTRTGAPFGSKLSLGTSTSKETRSSVTVATFLGRRNGGKKKIERTRGGISPGADGFVAGDERARIWRTWVRHRPASSTHSCPN